MKWIGLLIGIGISLSFLSCDSTAQESGCHVGYWKAIARTHDDSRCEQFDFLRIRSNGLITMADYIVACEDSGYNQVYVRDTDYNTRAYRVDGTDFYLLDDPHYYPSIEVMNCLGDRLTLTGMYSGNWNRLSDEDESAAQAIFELRCPYSYWDNCYGDLFGEKPCDVDSDCIYSDDCDDNECDAP